MTLGYTLNKDHQRTRLASTDPAYIAYPAASNAVAYAAGAMNQYTAVGLGAPGYDARGNLTGDGINRFAYDQNNRLLSATTPQSVSAYGYDGLGRRVTAAVAGTTTRTLMDGQREAGQYSAANALISRYVYGPGLDEHIVTIAASGAKICWGWKAMRGACAILMGRLPAAGASLGSGSFSAFSETTLGPSIASCSAVTMCSMTGLGDVAEDVGVEQVVHQRSTLRPSSRGRGRGDRGLRQPWRSAVRMPPFLGGSPAMV